MVSDFDLALDRALDALGQDPNGHAAPRDDGLDGLLAIADRLRALPVEDWPDPHFGDRLAGGVSEKLRSQHRNGRRRRWASTAVALSAAAAVALVLGLAPFSPLGSAPPVSAQTLARNAAAVSSGRGLPPVRFTEVVTAHPSARFQPAPPPSKVTQTVTFASASRWRVDATIVEANGAGVTHQSTVRNGETIAASSLSPAGIRSTWTITTHAGSRPGLPTAGVYGMILDPNSLLSAGDHGARNCGRSLALGGNGPSIAGRPTRLLELGPDPCPSAAVPESAGSAVFSVDKRTSLVLRARMYSSTGSLLEESDITRLDFGGPLPDSLFALPASAPAAHAPTTTTPESSRIGGLAELQTRLGHRPLLPTSLPPGLHQGRIAPVGTDPATGRLTTFTITYDDSDENPALQLYEAPATSQSVRFPGRTVTIRPGQTATLNTSPAMTTLWWIQDGTYISLQKGGQTGGVTLSGQLSQQQLIALAARTG